MKPVYTFLMKISEVIETLVHCYEGFDPHTSTRDRILYGDTEKECTGIVTTCFASIEVIEEAHQKHANLIICHESLFYNHGDHTDWLEVTGNSVYLRKKKLLDAYGITVYRNHDGIHHGLLLENGHRVDGIFLGLAREMGWDSYQYTKPGFPIIFEIPEEKASDIAGRIITKNNLHGCRIIGSPDTMVHKVMIYFHISGVPEDRDMITRIEKEDIDLVIAGEITDFTTAIYIRDSCAAGHNRAILNPGHFNIEEPGMKYMLTYLPQALNHEIPCFFIPSGDSFHWITSSSH